MQFSFLISIQKLMKKRLLEFRNAMRYVKRRIVKWLSYIILIISVFMLFIALGTNIAHRVPIISYLIKEMEMPYSLSLSGTVCILQNKSIQNDSDNNVESMEKVEVEVPITISVGGYYVETYSSETYTLNFTSLETSHIPLVLSFSIDGNEYNYVAYLDFENHQYSTKKDLFYCLED